MIPRLPAVSGRRPRGLLELSRSTACGSAALQLPRPRASAASARTVRARRRGEVAGGCAAAPPAGGPTRAGSRAPALRLGGRPRAPPASARSSPQEGRQLTEPVGHAGRLGRRMRAWCRAPPARTGRRRAGAGDLADHGVRVACRGRGSSRRWSRQHAQHAVRPPAARALARRIVSFRSSPRPARPGAQLRQQDREALAVGAAHDVGRPGRAARPRRSASPGSWLPLGASPGSCPGCSR